MRSISRPRRIWQQALALLAPPVCPACGRPGAARAFGWLCPRCRPKLTPGPLCLRCGRALAPTPALAGRHVRSCRVCRNLAVHFEFARSIAPYRGAWKTAVRAFKSRPAGDLLAQMAGLLRRRLISARLPGAWQAVAPIPARRLSQRHPPEALARELARRTSLRYLACLRFQRTTRAQRGLRRRERMRNLAGALRAEPAQVRGLSLLVVDDVWTTGATVQEAVRALRQAGAARVGVLTLARGADR